MNQALEVIERLRVEWLVYELGEPEQRARAWEKAQEILRDAGGVQGVTPAGVYRWSLFCADGSAAAIEGHRDEGGQVAFVKGRTWADLSISVAGVWGPYDVSDPHLAVWVLGLGG